MNPQTKVLNENKGNRVKRCNYLIKKLTTGNSLDHHFVEAYKGLLGREKIKG